MKKLICIIIASVLFTVPAFAEIDLSSLSFDELRQLQERISKELVTRPEWKSVPVPPGLYKIGLDIPAGEWQLTCYETRWERAYIKYGSAINTAGTEVIAPTEWAGYVNIAPDASSKTKINILLADGYYIEIQDGTVLFSTPERIDLGF